MLEDIFFQHEKQLLQSGCNIFTRTSAAGKDFELFNLSALSLTKNVRNPYLLILKFV